jgi:hypothetical protein
MVASAREARLATPMRHTPRLWLIVASALVPQLVLGCGDSGSSSDEVEDQTLIMVSPADFAGTGDCGAEGGLGAYVATLIDVTGDFVEGKKVIDEFFVDTSPPTSCTQSIGFATVVPDRAYEVIVEGYADTDGDPTTVDICTVKGTRVVLAKNGKQCTHEVVAPIQSWRCYGWQDPSDGSSGDGQGDGNPAIAIEYRSVSLHDCRLAD